jgi:iron complex transport system ATP-binding protein
VTLEAQALSLRSGAAVLVDALTFACPEAKLTAIVGPNGAGKSTLLRLLAGETAPSAGRVLIEGRPIAAFRPWELASRRAVMPQSASLAFPFTASEVAGLGVDGIGRGLSRRDRAEIVARALEQADVGHLAGRPFQTLSGGEQQRVHFARALAQLAAGRTICGRQILLLDEPIASLDLRHQLAVLETACGLARDGVTVVAVLHDLQFAARYADEVLVMHGGRRAAGGRPDEVLTASLLREVFGVRLTAPSLPALPWRRCEDGGACILQALIFPPSREHPRAATAR